MFLFNHRDELLLQRRAGSKLTWPGFWANTCCSHPLLNIRGEQDGAQGCRIAALRKLRHELGTDFGLVESDFAYTTRITYRADYDERFGEWEIDYLLFARLPARGGSPAETAAADARWS